MATADEVVFSYAVNASNLISANNAAAASFKQLGGATKEAGTAAQTASAGVKALSAAYRGVMALAIVKFVQSTVAAQEAAFRVTTKLNDALKNNADMATISSAAWEDYSKSISSYTAFSEQAVTSTIAMLGQQNLTADRIKSLTPLIADLASKYGLDLQSATLKVTRALGGSTRALSMLGIQMTGVVKGADNFAAVAAGLTKGVGGFARQVQFTASVAIAQFKNSLNELKITIGQGLAPIVSAIALTVKGFVDTINKVPKPVLQAAAALAVVVGVGKVFRGVWGTLAGAMTRAVQVFMPTFAGLGSVAQGADGATDSLTDLSSTMSSAATSSTVVGVTATKTAGALAVQGVATAAVSVETVNLARAYMAAQLALGSTVAQAEAATASMYGLAAANAAAGKSAPAMGAAQTGFSKFTTVLGGVGVAASIVAVGFGVVSSIMGMMKARAEAAAQAMAKLRLEAVMGSGAEGAAAIRAYAAKAAPPSLPSRFGAALGSRSVAESEVQQAAIIKRLTAEQAAYNEQIAASEAALKLADKALAQFGKTTQKMEKGQAAFLKTFATTGKAFQKFTGYDLQGAVKGIGELGMASYSARTAFTEMGAAQQAAGTEMGGTMEFILQLAREGGTAFEEYTKKHRDLAKAAEGVVQSQGALREAVTKTIEEVKAAAVDWKNSFMANMDVMQQGLADVGSQAKVTAADLMEAAVDAGESLRTWKSEFDLLDANFGNRPGFKDFMQDMGTLPLEDQVKIFQAINHEMSDKAAAGYFATVARNAKLLHATANDAFARLIGPVKDLVAAIKDLADRMFPAAKAGDEMARTADFMAQSLETARGEGDKMVSTADNLISSLGSIPPVHIDTAAAKAALDELLARTRELEGVKGTTSGGGGGHHGHGPPGPRPPVEPHSGGYIGSQGIKKMHRGGMMWDERAAVLQVGEFVMRREAVGRIGLGALHAMNSGRGGGGGDLNIKVVADRRQFRRSLDWDYSVQGF